MTSAARFFQTRRETAYRQPRKAEGRLDNLETSLTVKQWEKDGTKRRKGLLEMLVE
jgi:hypothetical protein